MQIHFVAEMKRWKRRPLNVNLIKYQMILQIQVNPLLADGRMLCRNIFNEQIGSYFFLSSADQNEPNTEMAPLSSDLDESANSVKELDVSLCLIIAQSH